ncbi:MAG: hypothetical protein JW912_03300, partial [Sedimentisphaerales bacterium]|nr:hypothetical protein [Sedimentisphaerales bacterium]
MKKELIILILLLMICFDCYASEQISQESSGPTVYLDYTFNKEKTNSVQDFMYFVPTISPT